MTSSPRPAAGNHTLGVIRRPVLAVLVLILLAHLFPGEETPAGLVSSFFTTYFLLPLIGSGLALVSRLRARGNGRWRG